MQITYDKPSLPNVTITFTPEEFILLGVVMGSIQGSTFNSIRSNEFDCNIYNAVEDYVEHHQVDVDLRKLCHRLVESNLVVADDQTWSLK